MSGRLLTTSVFLTIMGLLIAQRFYAVPPQVQVTVDTILGSGAFAIGENLRRGQIVETGDGYLKLTISDTSTLWLAADTRIELERLFEDELAIRFTKGRLVVDHHGEVPLKIQTNHTSHMVLDDTASFVNYDFLETVHVIPLSGSVQVSVETTGEQLLTPVPLSIHETEPVVLERLEVNLEAGDAGDFYRWVGVLTQ